MEWSWNGFISFNLFKNIFSQKDQHVSFDNFLDIVKKNWQF